MYLEFPFEYARVKGIGRLFYPVVIVQLKTVVGWKDFEFLVDTGADLTTVPVHLLPVLGLSKSELHVSKTLGVGGIGVKTWEFDLSVRFGSLETQVRTSAVECKDDSMPLLLGRKDIFEERFSLVLDSARKVTIFKEN